MEKEFSVIIGYRDRELNRMKKCLDSLAEQQLQNFETIVIDSGSRNENRTNLKKLASNYDFLKVHYNHTAGMPWNRALALNAGIRLAETPYIFSADMDLVFRSDFSTSIRKYLKSDDAYFFSVFLTDKKFNDWANIYKYTSFIRSGIKGKGISLIKKSVFFKVSGYNEFYSFWGYEDNDLYEKLSLNRIKCHFIETDLLYHQYHELSYNDAIQFPAGWRKFMEDHLHYHKDYDIDPKPYNWGRLYQKSDRPAENYFKNNTNPDEINLKGSLKFIEYLIHASIDKEQEKILKFTYQSNIDKFNKAKTTRIIDSVNRLLKRLEFIPFQILSKYRASYISVPEIRDLMMYIIYFRWNEISDYYLEMNMDQNLFTGIIVKRQ